MDKKECKRRAKNGDAVADLYPDNPCHLEIGVDLATFPETNPNPIVDADVHERIHYMNPAACNLMPDLMTAGNGHPFFCSILNPSLHRPRMRGHEQSTKK